MYLALGGDWSDFGQPEASETGTSDMSASEKPDPATDLSAQDQTSNK